MEKLNFKNGQFTVMQVSDAQDMHVVRKAMVTMLNKAYNKVKPDLVLFTGDNILGNHLRDARFGSKQIIFDKAGELSRMRTSLKHILQPVSDRKIPFAFIYGNHDDRNLITKEEQAQIYMSYPYCVPINQTDKSLACDTYYIPIFGENGSERLGIFMLDCAWYDKEEDRCYEMITPDTVKWYCEESERQRMRNGGRSILSFAFTHIPVPITKKLFVKCEEKDAFAVKAPGKDEYYKLDDTKAKGYAYGYPSVLSSDSGLFEAIKAQGNVKAVVFGHDHKNCFTASLDGIDIIGTPGASFRCFGNDLRGVRVFVFKEDDIENYETYTLTYFDLIKPTAISKLRYIWDADDKLGKIRL